MEQPNCGRISRVSWARRALRCVAWGLLVGTGLTWDAAAETARVEKVTVTGNRQLPSEAIRRRLGFVPPVAADTTLIERAEANVLAFCREEGFLRAQVGATLRPWRGDARELHVQVVEGERVRLDRVTLEGCRGLPVEAVEREMALRRGQPVSETLVLGDIDRILSLYDEEGFPFAEVSPEAFRLSPDGSGLAFVFRIREGSRVRLRGLEVEGNRITRLSTIQREMRLRFGEIYRQSRVDGGRDRLLRSGLFEEVSPVELRPGASGREVTVELQVVEAAVNAIEAGMGYVPAGPTSAEGYVTGRIDLRLGNIAGSGRSAEIHWRRFAPGSASWLLAYREPWVGGLPLSVGGDLRQEVRDSTYTTRGIGLMVALPISNSAELELDGRRERTTTGARGYGYREESQRTVLAGGILLDRRDRKTNPRSGAMVRLRAGWGRRRIERDVTGDSLAATERAEETHAEASGGIYLATAPARVLALEGDLRRIRTSRGEVPLYQLYYLGGSEGPRGYAEDEFAGARTARVALEQRFLLGGRSRFHLFLDLGYHSWKGDEAYEWGYGAGLRLESRLGIVALDVGFPLGEALSQGKLHLRLAEEW